MQVDTSCIISKEDVKIYKGKYYLPWFGNQGASPSSKMATKKVVVLDLDETIGSFADLYILWCGIRHGENHADLFNHLCDLYPEFFRYGMITILEYLYSQKLQKECDKLFIYTNNQCPGKWVYSIAEYLERKVKSGYRKMPKQPLFDKIIGAFKINNKPFETCRSSHVKKLDDFLRCSLVSENADICFVDDVHYPTMKSAKVYYICPRPFIHHLNTHTIIQRLLTVKWLPRGLLQCESFWKDWFSIHYYKMGRSKGKTRRKKHIKNSVEVELDLQVSQKLIFNLKEFMLWGMKSPNLPDLPPGDGANYNT